MNSPWSLITVVTSIIVATLLMSYLLSKTNLPITQWVPIGLSIASIAIAVLSAFKNELFEFSPTLIGGDFALIHSSESNYAHSAVLLPLHFVNRGYGEGAILGIAVEVINGKKNEKYLLTPIAEVDMTKLIQNTGRIHATNMIAPFMGFPLASKQVVSKSLAFGWVNTNPKYAQPNLDPAAFVFDIFIQTDRMEVPKKMLTIKHTFSQEELDSFVKGSAIYNLRANPFESH